MATETEFRYLFVASNQSAIFNLLLKQSRHLFTTLEQFYIARGPHGSVRARKKKVWDGNAMPCELTVKGSKSGPTCVEINKDITENEYNQLYTMCAGSVIRKTRIRYFVDLYPECPEDDDSPLDCEEVRHELDIDIFTDGYEGIVIVELEFDDDDIPAVITPVVTSYHYMQQILEHFTNKGLKGLKMFDVTEDSMLANSVMADAASGCHT